MKAFDFAVPVKGDKVPASAAWLHEVKHDGYRLMLVREDARARLLSKGGIDWSGRFPWIVESALRVRHKRFAVDGEAVLLGVDGVSDFDGLHSRKHDHEVQLYAFDCLMDDGDDLRRLPLSMRKVSLERLLARRADGISVAPFEKRRDRAGPVPRGVRHGAGGAGVEGWRASLYRRPLLALDQGQEPETPSLSPRAGSILSGVPAGAELKRLPMTARVYDFASIRQRLDEIEGKDKSPLGRKPDTPKCDHCKGRGYLVNSWPSSRGKVPCPYCDPRL